METFADKLIFYVVAIIGFVTAFGLAVFIHELGHFLAAKFFKVPVERFVIGFDKEAMPGMPKCIWEKKYGETTYGLSLMPLGGYVKMVGTIHPELEAYLGDDPEPKNKKGEEEAEDAAVSNAPPHESPVEFVDTAVASSNVPRPEDDEKERQSLSEQAMTDQAALYKKPLYQKVIIYGAGVFMNLVLATAVVTFQAVAGETVNAPLPAVVAWQAPDSPLHDADVRQGDVLLEVDGTEVSTNREYFSALASALPEEATGEEIPLMLELEREGEPLTREFTVVMEEESPTVRALGRLITYPAYVDDVIPARPAQKAGIELGDMIREINGEPVDDFNELLYLVSSSPGEPLDMLIERDGEMIEMTITPVASADDPSIGQIGIFPGNPEKLIEKMSVGEALVTSPVFIAQYTMRYVNHLKMLGGRLVQGDIAKVREDLGGPVAIAHMAGIMANQGVERFLRFLIMLNIALAVMNILPLPILDGGHIVMATWEAIFGKPIPPKVLVPVLNGAVIVLLGFVVLITVSDLFKIFG